MFQINLEMNVDMIEIRDATAKDYEAVLGLDREHKIYGGNDYLPTYYHQFLQDPDKELRLVIRNGKVVSAIHILLNRCINMIMNIKSNSV